MLKLAVFSVSLAIHLSVHAEILSTYPISDEKAIEFGLPVNSAHDSIGSSTVMKSEDPPFYLSLHSPISSLPTNSPGTTSTNGIETVAIVIAPSVSTTTEYITLPPFTTTEIIENVSTLTSPPESTQLPVTGSQTRWSSPERMKDLSSFNVMSFPSGRGNVKLVSSLPFSSSRTANDPSGAQSIIQVLYPAHSINPAQRPVGGASFYASPLELSSATNVSLRYSVFFSPDFDWVKGGKLPGLYGGHTGCSGGSEAEDCFSTRLMWRAGGVGELYLYAPKSHQPDSLCSSIGSTCNTDYGFSIGRGSFTWTSGAWTTVTQTVVLNSEGEANGWFTLDVNGKVVLTRQDVYYRHDGQRPSVRPTTTTAEHSVTKTWGQPTETNNGGLLGLLNPLLGHSEGTKGILSGISGLLTGRAHDERLYWTDSDRVHRLFSINPGSLDGGSTRLQDSLDGKVNIPPLVSAGASLDLGESKEGISVKVGLAVDNDVHNNGDKKQQKEAVGLIGIFFSTFFGGHEEKYATPKDQYVWFKDFLLAINN